MCCHTTVLWKDIAALSLKKVDNDFLSESGLKHIPVEAMEQEDHFIENLMYFHVYPLVSLLFSVIKEFFCWRRAELRQSNSKQMSKMLAFVDFLLNIEMVWSPGGTQVQK